MKHLYNLNVTKKSLRKSQLVLLKLLASGMTMKEIAVLLNISSNTAKTRLKTLYKKFGVISRAGLIKRALKFNIIKSTDVKSRFRKRFSKKDYNIEDAGIYEPLTEEEIKYINLICLGKSQKEIIKSIPLSGIFHARVLAITICSKLNAKNITHAVAKIYRLENILKTTF